MRLIPAICLGVLAAGPLAAADVVALNPVADAFLSSAQPGNNYGGAGALAIAAPGLARGEFQTVLRFDTGTAVSAFDAAFGAGQWSIRTVTLQLTATPPNNGIFNPAGAGEFAVGWMQNDGWDEGVGMPSSPGSNGITFATLPTYLRAADEPLGFFTFNGATSGHGSYALTVTSGFATDLGAGGLVGLRLWVPGSTTAYTFNSRNFGTVASRPVLSILAGRRCGSADFNGDGDVGTDADIEAFFACLAGNCCAACGSADFNGDGDVGTDADIETFFRVLAGGSC